MPIVLEEQRAEIDRLTLELKNARAELEMLLHGKGCYCAKCAPGPFAVPAIARIVIP